MSQEFKLTKNKYLWSDFKKKREGLYTEDPMGKQNALDGAAVHVTRKIVFIIWY